MNKKKSYEGINKLAIIEEYLSGDDTYKALGTKYDVSPGTIKSWVRSYRKSGRKSIKKSEEANSEREKELLNELEKARLKNELLEEIIKLSEQNTGVDLRKKFGSKQ